MIPNYPKEKPLMKLPGGNISGLYVSRVGGKIRLKIVDGHYSDGCGRGWVNSELFRYFKTERGLLRSIFRDFHPTSDEGAAEIEREVINDCPPTPTR